jgi:hypothetical protein
MFHRADWSSQSAHSLHVVQGAEIFTRHAVHLPNRRHNRWIGRDWWNPLSLQEMQTQNEADAPAGGKPCWRVGMGTEAVKPAGSKTRLRV